MAKKASYTIVKKPQTFLDKTPKAKGVTLAKDGKGYFIFTHRSKSGHYGSISGIPKSIIEQIESTG